MDPEEKVLELEKELELLRPLKDSSAQKEAEYKAKEDTWLKEKVELSEAINPNWQKARATIEQLKAIAKEKGVELNDDGSVKSNPGNVDIQAIEQRAINAARGELLGTRLEEMLEQYSDPKDKDLVKHYYNKVTNGETVTLQNMSKFISQAESLAKGESGNPLKRIASFSGGQGPRSSESTKMSDEEAIERGKKWGFGFANQSKK